MGGVRICVVGSVLCVVMAMAMAMSCLTFGGGSETAGMEAVVLPPHYCVQRHGTIMTDRQTDIAYLPNYSIYRKKPI